MFVGFMASIITGSIGRKFINQWCLIDRDIRAGINCLLDVGGIAVATKIVQVGLKSVFSGGGSFQLVSFKGRQFSRSRVANWGVVCLGALAMGMRLKSYFTLRSKRALVSKKIQEIAGEQERETDEIQAVRKRVPKSVQGFYQELLKFRLSHQILVILMDPQGDHNDGCLPDADLLEKFPLRLLRFQVISNTTHLRHFAGQLHRASRVFEWIIVHAHGNGPLIDWGEERMGEADLNERTWVDLSRCTTKGIIFFSCMSGVAGGIVERIAAFPLSTRLLAPVEDINHLSVDLFGGIGWGERPGYFWDERMKLIVALAHALYPEGIEGVTIGEIQERCPLIASLIQIRTERQTHIHMQMTLSLVALRVFETGDDPKAVQPQDVFLSKAPE